jgi:hypothetical protein
MAAAPEYSAQISKLNLLRSGIKMIKSGASQRQDNVRH